jgi:uncharacterized protein (DUF1786 family)
MGPACGRGSIGKGDSRPSRIISARDYPGKSREQHTNTWTFSRSPQGGSNMRILAIDIGTGTQDIVLFDSSREPENCFKMVMPAPTQIYAARIREATTQRLPLALSGRLMGGGPVSSAIEAHIKSGLPVYAEAQAARTMNDDLERVRAIGVHIIGQGDRLPTGAVNLELKDLDLESIGAALTAFGLTPEYDGLAVAALDHGNAPPDVSDRIFRFQHIQRIAALACAQVQSDPELGLLAFAYLGSELPDYLTRLRAIAESAPAGLPLVLLDTGAAASLGALQDPRVRRHRNLVLVNVGNMHTLATHIDHGRLAGIVEHHTHRLTPVQLADYVARLAWGALTDEEVFADHGHGCFVAPGDGRSTMRPFVSVTGPRRGMLAPGLRGTQFTPGSPYYAVPHGDMMTAGCWGLVRACAHKVPAWSSEIQRALAK